MRALFDEYADALYVALISIMLITIFISNMFVDLIGVNLELVESSLKPVNIESNISPVTISSFKARDILVNINGSLEYLDRIEAYNSKGEDIRDYVTVMGFDSSSVGVRDITYKLNYNGESRAIRAKLRVVNEREEISS